MKAIMLENKLSLGVVEVRVREIAGHCGVVVPQVRTQQDRSRAVEGDGERGQMPGVAIVESLRGFVTYRHIAVLVEDTECVAMFEDQGRGLDQRTRRANGEDLLGIAPSPEGQSLVSRRSFCAGCRFVHTSNPFGESPSLVVYPTPQM